MNNSSKSEKNLVLIDDFVGSGDTFISWYNENKDTLANFKNVIYAVLITLDKGIRKIEEKTAVRTITPFRLNDSDRVFQGRSFSSQEKDDLRHMIEKYKKRLPEKYIYGYDDSQLLISFDDNIPNNSLSILRSGKTGWTPLIKRK